MARNRQTAWRVEGYRQEIRDHGGPLAETRGQERTAFPDRRVFRHGGFVAGRGQAHAPQDRLMPRKQRHTARRVYARLVEEEGFQGSYSSVQRYVKRWREEHRSDGDGYLELDWRAGVMQVDFGEAVATIGGGDVRVHCLVATFPHSNMRYVAAMPGENAECVCEGPAQILDHIGMAPRVLVLDNATRRGPPRRVGQGHRGARVRHVLRPLPARDEVLQPVFRQRERVRRERGRLPAPQPHGPQAQRGEPQTAGEASAVEVRRDRGRGPLPFRQADTRAVRRGARGDAAAAARVSTRSNESSARPTRRATSRSARPVTSRARHGAAGRCSPACARSRRRSAPPTAGT